MHPPIPRIVSDDTLAVLVKAKLVLLDGDCYTVRGLDAERNRRSDAARNAAAMRWHSGSNADGNAESMPRRDETSTRRS
jgi:hypothetical protein